MQALGIDSQTVLTRTNDQLFPAVHRMAASPWAARAAALSFSFPAGDDEIWTRTGATNLVVSPPGSQPEVKDPDTSASHTVWTEQNNLTSGGSDIHWYNHVLATRGSYTTIDRDDFAQLDGVQITWQRRTRRDGNGVRLFNNTVCTACCGYWERSVVHASVVGTPANPIAGGFNLDVTWPSVFGDYVAYRKTVSPLSAPTPGIQCPGSLNPSGDIAFYNTATNSETPIPDPGGPGTSDERFPHLHDGAIAYERGGAIFRYVISTGVESAVELPEIVGVPGVNTCNSYGRPRVGGANGDYVLFLGSGSCTGVDGLAYDRILYVTRVSTGDVFEVTTDLALVFASLDDEKTLYDISDDAIVHLRVVGGVYDVVLTNAQL